MLIYGPPESMFMKSNRGGKTMKKIMALLMLAIFVAAMSPSVFAEEGSSDTAGTGSDAGDSPDVDIVTTDVGDDEGLVITPISADETKTVRERLSSLKQVAIKVMTKTQEVKDYYKEKLQVAVRMCQDEADDPATCKEKIRERLSLVENLGDEALQQLQSIEARKTQAMLKIKEMKDNEELRKFKVKIGNEFKARYLAKGDVEIARVKYKGAQERYELAKEDYDAARSLFEQAKEAFENCEGECNQFEGDLKEQAKAYMLTVIERIREQLNKADAKVEESPELTDGEAVESEAEIEEELSDIDALEVEVEAITEDTPKEEISALALKMNNKWADETRDKIVKTAGFLQAAKMGGVYGQLRQLSKRLENTLAKMVERGKDTAAAESLVDDFNSKLESVEAIYLEAVAKFKEASTAQDPEARKAALTEAQAKMKEAHTALSEARKALGDIVKELRNKNAVAELEEDEAEEILDEEEAELEDGDTVEVVIEDDTATVTVEIDDVEETFTVESTDVEEIEDEIVEQTGLDEETVEELTEIEVVEPAETVTVETELAETEVQEEA